MNKKDEPAPPASGPVQPDENELVKERRRKHQALLALGVDPFGGRFDKEAPLSAIAAAYQDHKKVRAAGRLTAQRFMGKSVFCDLKDESGRLQIYLKRTELDERALALFDLLDLGDIVGVEGELFKTKTGEISVKVTRLELLAKSLRPLPEKWHGLKDVEVRYRRRYLDLAANDETQDIFRKRSLIVRSIRKTLDDRGYLEVETPMMHPIPGGAAGKPFQTHHEALGVDLFLRVAPELYLKRLLVGGFDKVYEINKSFRNEGISTRHNPEFTMLEVYTAYHDVNDVMDLCEAIVRGASESVFGTTKIVSGGAVVDLGRFERVSFAKLMRDGFGISPDEETSEWVRKLKSKGVKIEGKELSRTQIINIVADLLEPAKAALDGEGRPVHTPVFVTEYFAELSPLARKNKDNPLLSDRFELYINGMEIANGYSEQNDPIEQRARFLEEIREKGQKPSANNFDEDYLYALEHGMPPAGGLGIGVDRLVMVLTGQPSIREVILFPQMKPER